MIVGDHQQGALVSAGLFQQQIDHILLIGLVEVSGRLVRQQ